MGKKKNKKNTRPQTEQPQNNEPRQQSWLTPTNIAMLSLGVAGFAAAVH